ncbi:MAG: tetratricopeptide repeat protein [Desulfobacterales bacterium]|nr:tetratricopeptide repeat protein [Desulfobacterales bacterium]
MSAVSKIVCILILVVGVLFGCADSNSDRAAKYIDSARQLVAAQKPETALIEYKNALELDPDSDVALFELAETYILMNKVDAAIRYYTLAAQTNPDRIEPYLRLAQIYTRTERLLEARAQITKARAVDPNSVNALHLLSGVQIRERDFVAAIDTLKKAETIDPDNIQTLLALAQLFVKTKKVSQAEVFFKKAISLDAGSRDAYMGLVRLYTVQGRADKVAELMAKVVTTPGIPAVKYNDMARFYESRGESEQAEAYYQKAMDVAPGEVFPIMALARFFTRENSPQQAVDLLNQALESLGNRPAMKRILLIGVSRVHQHFGDIPAAESAVEKALALKNHDADALFQKGRILMAKGNFKTALDLFDQVLAINRFHAKAFYFRAICIQERGASDRPEQRIFRAAAGMLDNPEEFEKNQIRENLIAAVTIDPRLVEARRALAVQYLMEKRADKAREQVDEILELGAPDHLTMNILAGIHMLEGNPGKAEQILKAIIREQPEYVPAYIRLGFFYKNEGDTEQAAFYFKKAYDRDPTAIGLIEEINRIYIQRQSYAQALALIDQSAGKAGEDAAAFFNHLRGEVFLAEGRVHEAKGAFKAAVNADPEFIRPRMRLARYWLGRGDRENALEQYQAVEAVAESYLPALMGMAMIWDAKGDAVKAERYYRRVLALDSRNTLATNNLAFLLTGKQDGLEEAFRLAQTARTLAPDNPDVLDTLGWIYYLKGSYHNALAEFEEGLKLDPENAILQYHYGMALYMTKAYEKARKHLKKALSLDSDFEGADAARKILN